MSDPKLQRPKAVLVGVQLGDVSDLEHTSSLAELGRLVHTLGYQVVGEVTQRRSSLGPCRSQIVPPPPRTRRAGRPSQRRRARRGATRG
jgi:hypothetical protein